MKTERQVGAFHWSFILGPVLFQLFMGTVSFDHQHNLMQEPL